MARQRASKTHKAAAAAFKGRRNKEKNAANQSLPTKAIWIIISFLVLATIMVIMLT